MHDYIFVIVHVTSSMNMIMSSVMVCHGGVLFQMQSSVVGSHVLSWHPAYSYAISLLYECGVNILWQHKSKRTPSFLVQVIHGTLCIGLLNAVSTSSMALFESFLGESSRFVMQNNIFLIVHVPSSVNMTMLNVMVSSGCFISNAK